jgi:hypothetical protein
MSGREVLRLAVPRLRSGQALAPFRFAPFDYAQGRQDRPFVPQGKPFVSQGKRDDNLWRGDGQRRAAGTGAGYHNLYYTTLGCFVKDVLRLVHKNRGEVEI